MKSYNNLYEKMLSDDNIRLAIMEAARNKRKNNRRHRRLRYMAKHADECSTNGYIFRVSKICRLL